jgi:hypothetical protein
LVGIAHDELKCVAYFKVSSEPQGPSFNVTALVHEAYLRLEGDERITFLRDSCGTDEDLLGQVKALLDAHNE